MSKKITTSICIITYNQEKYIGQCIEAALSQTESSKEVIVADDCSTDNTYKICKEYQTKYPNIVKAVRREKNLGLVKNWIEILKEAQGQYIALCEGDDYWTDPDKIKKQSNFLTKNPDYILTYHNWVNIHSDTKITDEQIQNAKIKISPMTLTLLFRNKSELYMDVLQCNPATADTPIRFALKGHGKFKYLDDIAPSVRRVHGLNVMGAMNRFEQLPMRIQTQEALLSFYKNTNRRCEIESVLVPMYALRSAQNVRNSKGFDKLKLFFREAKLYINKGVFIYYLRSVLFG